jgi:hypothetical protein
VEINSSNFNGVFLAYFPEALLSIVGMKAAFLIISMASSRFKV